MKQRTLIKRCFSSVLALCLMMFICMPVSAEDGKKPSITITSVPKDAPGDNMASEPIKGTVVDGNPKEQKVVIYARGGNTWYVQPTTASPLTDIGGDGKWESETHGGVDFLALLVKSTYDAKATLDAIPPISGDILARATMKPKK